MSPKVFQGANGSPTSKLALRIYRKLALGNRTNMFVLINCSHRDLLAPDIDLDDVIHVVPQRAVELLATTALCADSCFGFSFGINILRSVCSHCGLDGEDRFSNLADDVSYRWRAKHDHRVMSSFLANATLAAPLQLHCNAHVPHPFGNNVELPGQANVEQQVGCGSPRLRSSIREYGLSYTDNVK